MYSSSCCHEFAAVLRVADVIASVVADVLRSRDLSQHPFAVGEGRSAGIAGRSLVFDPASVRGCFRYTICEASGCVAGCFGGVGGHKGCITVDPYNSSIPTLIVCGRDILCGTFGQGCECG